MTDLIIQWRRSLQDQQSMSQDVFALNNLSFANHQDKEAPESAPAIKSEHLAPVISGEHAVSRTPSHVE